MKDFKSIIKTISIFSTLIAIWIVISSCAKQEKKKQIQEKVEKECVLEPEQINSLQGRWSTPPIKVTFRQDEWGAGEIDAIKAGADTWNKFFSSSRGFEILDASGTTSNLNQGAPSCIGNTISDGTVLYKRQSTWTKGGAAVAVTTTCFSNLTGSLPKIYNAIMEFNYVNFFVEGKQLPDLQSIALHEFGHLMGLDHSCGPLGKPNQNEANVACPDASSGASDPIIESVMFPTVFFDPSSGRGEEKRELKKNDQGRANCLYEDLTTNSGS